ncbi:kelch-like protein 12 [Stylophora pistillata]|uniref:kelch-like protein 12 n=1 Tax=Stylophora pistillata TaxID=50429 RepID=UPI000C040691|nr:kelch-like protein 12 [Stylophora pistillata]
MAEYFRTFVLRCAQFRDEGQFIDVRLKVGEDVLQAHRIVLAAHSDYFCDMFKDGMLEVIELKHEGISPAALRVVIESIYDRNIRIHLHNVFEVLAGADHLKVSTVVQQCCDFLQREFVQDRLDLHNYCLIFAAADRHGLKDLKEEAERKLASIYKDVCQSEEFLSIIEPNQLVSLLSRDDLSALSETFVFVSAMQWIKHKKKERMAFAAKVIGALRLGLVDIRVVIEELNTEEMQRS